MVNSLLTILIKVNVPVGDAIRLLTTGDDHEVQKSAPDPWTLVLAVRLWLERRWRHRLTEFRPVPADFRENSDDLRLGVDRLFASVAVAANSGRRSGTAAFIAPVSEPRLANG
jgi:hypothetical protein